MTITLTVTTPIGAPDAPLLLAAYNQALGIITPSTSSTTSASTALDYFPSDPGLAPFPSPENSQQLVLSGAVTGEPYLKDSSGQGAYADHAGRRRRVSGEWRGARPFRLIQHAAQRTHRAARNGVSDPERHRHRASAVGERQRLWRYPAPGLGTRHYLRWHFRACRRSSRHRHLRRSPRAAAAGSLTAALPTPHCRPSPRESTPAWPATRCRSIRGLIRRRFPPGSVPLHLIGTGVTIDGTGLDASLAHGKGMMVPNADCDH